MQIDLTPEEFQAELAAFDDAMYAIGLRFQALPEGSPQELVLTAEVEVRISRMQSIMDQYHERKRKRATRKKANWLTRWLWWV